MSNLMIDDKDLEEVEVTVTEVNTNEKKEDNKIKKINSKALPLINNLSEQISRLLKDAKNIKLNLAKLSNAYNQDLKKYSKLKLKRKDGRKVAGFMKPKTVPIKLETFLKLEPGTKMTRNQIVKLMYKKIQESDLIYDKDGRVFRANNDLRKLFNLPKSVNDSVDPKDKDGFNFYNFQKHIAKLYKEDKKIQNELIIIDEEIKSKKHRKKKKKGKKKNKNKVIH